MQGKLHTSLKTIEALRKLTDRICRKFPDADRTTIYHTLQSLRKEPLERLNLALLRAQKRQIYI